MSERKDELIQEIGRLILSDGEVAGRDFDGLALVVQAEDDDLFALSGYLYDRGSSYPFVPDDNVDALEEVLGEFRVASIAGMEDQKPFVSLLIQITKPDLEVEMQVEYDDVNRWQVTPTNLSTMREALSPSAGF